MFVGNFGADIWLCLVVCCLVLPFGLDCGFCCFDLFGVIVYLCLTCLLIYYLMFCLVV